jgi:beta-lactamase class D
MSLREAMPISNVPVYQELARRIGRERMAEGVRQLGYGSMEIGEVVDRFWLDGPLAISALEQVEFLTRLAEGTLPLPGEVHDAAREILRVDAGVDDRGQAWTLFAKTGTSLRDSGGIGWWVGWVERGDALHVFALNVDFASQADMPRRVPLGRALLVRMSALPGG